MPHVRTRGFVVREVPVGESDRIIGLLTEDLGLISVSVRGARRARSAQLLTTQIFSFSEFELFCNKGHYSLNSSELIEPFLALQQDLNRLVCAAHLAEVLVDCLRDDVAQPALYRLWAYSLQAIQNQPDPLLLVHIAQLRLLAEIGLSPHLDSCVICGNQPERRDAPVLAFSIRSCGLVCGRPDCLARAADARPLPEGSLACLRHIGQAALPRLFNFSLTADVRQSVMQLSEQYLTHHMEKAYTRLQMLQTLDLPGCQTGKLPSPQKSCKADASPSSSATGTGCHSDGNKEV